MPRLFPFALPFLAALAAGPAGAADRREPAVLKAAVACRAIAADVDRLACYDRAVAALDKAASSADVVVLDRQEVQQTRRSLFGLSLPRLFGGRSDPATRPLDRLETAVASVARDADNRLLFTVEDGARWRQVDDRPSSRVRPGGKVELHRAALGSYFANFPGLVSIRVRREN